MPALMVNGSRLWNSLMELAKIGATAKSGVCRITLTDIGRQGRDRFRTGCNVLAAAVLECAAAA